MADTTNVKVQTSTRDLLPKVGAPRRQTSFRPTVTIADQQILVLCDQLDTVDLNRLTEPAGFLNAEELQRVDEALALVLDL